MKKKTHFPNYINVNEVVDVARRRCTKYVEIVCRKFSKTNTRTIKVVMSVIIIILKLSMVARKVENNTVRAPLRFEGLVIRKPFQ